MKDRISVLRGISSRFGSDAGDKIFEIAKFPQGIGIAEPFDLRAIGGVDKVLMVSPWAEAHDRVQQPGRAECHAASPVRQRLGLGRPLDQRQKAPATDIAPGIIERRSRRLALADRPGFYDSIYRQGSSVAHSDLYSINMLGLYQRPEGLVLAPDPHMPIVLALHCAIFDIVQCGEALAKAGVPAPIELLDALVDEWWTCV